MSVILFYLHRLPLKLIKVDEVTGEPLRDESGFCIQCPPNEPGEFIGKVVRGDPVKGTIIKYTYIRLLISCGRVIRDFEREAKTRCNF